MHHTFLLHVAVSSLIVILPSLLLGVAAQTNPSGSCNSCCQGPAGIPGNNGIPGSPGNNGLIGRDGLKGDCGNIGSVGPAGERGLPGPQGPIGQIGDPGPRGLQGLAGKVGPKGMQGIPGLAGQLGPIDEKGRAGEIAEIRQSAFTVIKTSQQSTSSIEVITFDTVETNVGNHFDSSTHKFTCQYPGTYVFTFTTTISGRQSINVALVKDGAKIASAICYDPDSVNHQSSNTVVVQLDEGNQVWLQGSGHIYSDTNRYTTFAGFLLYG